MLGKEDLVDNATCIYILYWNIDIPYIGQTTNFRKRCNAHLSSLRRGDHCNYKIQKEFDILGIDPTIEILEECSLLHLNILEEQYIKEFDSINNGLNIISGGYSVGTGINNPASVYSEASLIKVFELLIDPYNSYKYISEQTSVAESTITKIVGGVHHRWLWEQYPEMAIIIASSKKLRKTNSTCAASQNKKYRKIMSPDGKIYEVTNTLQFSKEHNLRNGNLCLVLTGKRKSVSGWVGV